MPHFKWCGIDLSGKLHSGMMLARSPEELSSYLFNENIALVRYQLKKPIPFLQRIPLQIKINFFKQLSLLLGSGIFLDQALQLVLHQVKNRFFKAVIEDILIDIQHGVSLSKALKNYPTIFDNVTIAMVEAGQESGTLVHALEQLCDHQEILLDFKKKIKAVLLVPAITFLFFIIIALIIFLVIVPTFGTMFISANQQLSKSTELIIWTSDFIASKWSVVCLMVILFFTVFIKYYILRITQIKFLTQYCLLATPIIGVVIRNSTFAYFFQSLAILTKTGVHLVTALSIAHQSIGNVILKNKLEQIHTTLAQGNSLSLSVSQQPNLFSEQIVALLAVGQESGCLPFIFYQIASLHKDHVNRLLSTIATLLQPLLMIILGLLITMLVFALYVPLFNLSSVIA
jgi:type IV pilus assembly protein PilC